MCLYLHVVFTQTDTSHVQYLPTLTSLSPIANGPRQAGRWKEKEASVQIVVFLHAVAAVSVYIEVQRREPARLPGQTVR